MPLWQYWLIALHNLWTWQQHEVKFLVIFNFHGFLIRERLFSARVFTPLTRLNYTVINEDNFLCLLTEIKQIFHFLEKQKITFIFQKKRYSTNGTLITYNSQKAFFPIIYFLYFLTKFNHNADSLTFSELAVQCITLISSDVAVVSIFSQLHPPLSSFHNPKELFLFWVLTKHKLLNLISKFQNMFILSFKF